jgi:hypothetical protein
VRAQRLDKLRLISESLAITKSMIAGLRHLRYLPDKVEEQSTFFVEWPAMFRTQNAI